jgi:hypothetical protein
VPQAAVVVYVEKHCRNKCNINKSDVVTIVIAGEIFNYLYPLVLWWSRVLCCGSRNEIHRVRLQNRVVE